jgi:hypothetical protein
MIRVTRDSDDEGDEIPISVNDDFVAGHHDEV